MMWP